MTGRLVVEHAKPVRLLLELPVPVLTAPPANTQPGLTLTRDRGLVERTVVNGALAAAGPETLPQPDGSVRLYATWTQGGEPLLWHRYLEDDPIVERHWLGRWKRTARYPRRSPP
ncbi:hypothetical protein ACWCXX_39105 [Streptomyces sp. NPDC001732]